MPNPQLTQPPKSHTEMLVRKPAAEVFEALVSPDLTTQFWFTKGSGRLEVGKQVRWDWEMYDVSIIVTPTIIEPHERIVVDWPGYSGLTSVEWKLASQHDGTTYVRISESGFVGDADDLMNYVVDSTQGFTWMLAGLKAFLEHGVRLNLTADAHPSGVVEAGA